MKHTNSSIAAVVLICMTGLSAMAQTEEATVASEYMQVANGMTKDIGFTAVGSDVAELVRASADHGNPQAAYMTGVFYLLGVGASADKALGEKYLKLAAGKGIAEAQAFLVREYKLGGHLEKNDVECARWTNALSNNPNQYWRDTSAGNQLTFLNEVLAKAIQDYCGVRN